MVVVVVVVVVVVEVVVVAVAVAVLVIIVVIVFEVAEVVAALVVTGGRSCISIRKPITRFCS